MTELRTIFDEDAELYDRARPAYLEPLFDELMRMAGLGPGSRALEIGAGTGKATVPLARRGLGPRIGPACSRGIAGVIAEHGGRVRKHHVFTLTVARRR